ncbi:MAG TPA: carbohydrate-binding protein, partial [Cellvibrio sp.]
MMITLLSRLTQMRHLATTGCLLLATLAMPSQAVVFQAENYNNFFDTTPGNTGGAFRNDAVDIEITNDSGGGYNVGWITATEWLVYNNLSIPTSGNYTIRLRV